MSGSALVLPVLAGLVLAGAGILYLGAAALMTLRLAGRPLPVPTAHDPVTVLKPLHGAEPGLEDNLRSFLRQDYGAPIQVVFGVQNPADPAIAIVRSLQDDHPDQDIELVVDGRLHGTNRKVSNLENMAARARHPVIVLADSDMRVGPDYLAGVVSVLAAPGVGAVTCLYHGIAGEGRPARLMALGIDSHFLPGVAMGVGLGIGHPCMGSTIALRRETLDAIGGFRSIADALADDHAIGERVRALGLAVAVTPFTIGHVCGVETLGELAHQELRWSKTVRQIEPVGHAGAVVSHPLPFGLIALALAPNAITAGVAAAAIAARIGLCLAAERAFGLKPHPYWLVPARDLLSFVVYAASFFGRGVQWRGYRYEVARSGALLPKTRPDAS